MNDSIESLLTNSLYIEPSVVDGVLTFSVNGVKVEALTTGEIAIHGVLNAFAKDHACQFARKHFQG